ncbi:MAM33, mitochondrial matrix glycoprotein [Phaffia rhodozyma]|uniref:MAM33, mitochondrial matrix glycoprotein n=1 Tax=Phaffia rhodozyma TaxID=264483 RepID=A0A0F7SE70_PHARH|nr:MAM33, mitochondrial matrix glycoprotein [Phaffia rhodozyma]
MASRTLRTLVSRAAAPSLIARSSAVSSLRAVIPVATRSFSLSAFQRASRQDDIALVSALSQEITFENENIAQDDLATTTENLKTRGWEITDKPGNEEVTFTKTIENEVIKVTIAASDLPEEKPVEEEEDVEADEFDDMPGTIVTVSITKPKENAQALVFQTTIQDGDFTIERVSLYKDSKLQTEETAEAEFKKRGVYDGPSFENLDPEVQDQFASFLTSRGIDEEFASELGEYQRHKEQKEYVSWLENVKTFVDL